MIEIDDIVKHYSKVADSNVEERNDAVDTESILRELDEYSSDNSPGVKLAKTNTNSITDVATHVVNELKTAGEEIARERERFSEVFSDVDCIPPEVSQEEKIAMIRAMSRSDEGDIVSLLPDRILINDEATPFAGLSKVASQYKMHSILDEAVISNAASEYVKTAFDKHADFFANNDGRIGVFFMKSLGMLGETE